MSRQRLGMLNVILICLGIWVGTGCSSMTGSSPQNPAAALGNYSAEPDGQAKARVAVADIRVEADGATSPDFLSRAAARDAAELLGKTNRFDVTGPDNFASLLQNKNASDAVRRAVLVHPISLPGQDYLLLASVTDLKIEKQRQPPGLFDKAKDLVTRSTPTNEIAVTASCGVNLQLVDPATSDVAITNSSAFQFSGPASMVGISIPASLAATTNPSDALFITDEDRSTIAKMALDDAIRKSLPKIDRLMQSRNSSTIREVQAPTPQPVVNVPASAPPAPIATTSPSSPVAAERTCPVCGAKVPAGMKFCPRCGSRVD